MSEKHSFSDEVMPGFQPARSPAEIAVVEFMPGKRSFSGEMMRGS